MTLTAFAQENKEESNGAEISFSSSNNPYYDRLNANLEFLKKHLGIKMAFCQHLMYMIANEDRGIPELYERREPWGYPDAEKYVERIRRNLHSLEMNPEMKLNYQFACVDLEDIEKNHPNVFQMIRKYYEKGQLDFIGGDFSAAHEQVLSSESNWRQIEYGVDYYKRKFGKQITVYARQESAFHEQISQILKKFGYKYIVPGAFPYHVEIEDGTFEFGASHLGAFFTQKDEFVNAVSLDGTSLPFFLNIDAQAGQQEWMHKMKIQRDLYGSTPLWTYFPDLIEVDTDLYKGFTDKYDLVFLEDGLDERLKVAPPKADARIHSYWSYTGEGIWAEEHQRTVDAAEAKALMAEGMNVMNTLKTSEDSYSSSIYDIWYNILKYQHHDLTWVETQDIRRKGIDTMKSGINKCLDYAALMKDNFVTKKRSKQVIFNTLPYQRKALVEMTGENVPGTADSFQIFNGVQYGFVDLNAGGTTCISTTKKVASSTEKEREHQIKTSHYTVTFTETGLIAQITTGNGRNLLDSSDYVGGEIRGYYDGVWKDNKNFSSRLYDGPVAYIMERKGKMDSTPVVERYFFFKENNLIKVELDFDFDHQEVGDYNLDVTKLNVYYPIGQGEMYREIPYGYLPAKESRPFFVTNWFYGDGLVYVNKGTKKQWVENGVMANVLAWGGYGINNRIHYDFWAQRSFDQRLNGKHKIEYYLIPTDEFKPAEIIREVDNLIADTYISEGQGENKSYYSVEREDLRITATYMKEGEVWVRGYKIPSERPSRLRDFEIFDMKLKDLKK